MSNKDTAQSKTEPPSPKRLRDLRKKGQVAKSRDVPATVSLVVGIGSLAVAGSYLLNGFNELLAGAASTDFRILSDPAVFIGLLRSLAVHGILLTLPFVVALAVVIALVEFLQVGPIFSLEPVKAQLSRLNPIEGVKRLFSLNNALELIKLLIKSILLAAIAWIIGEYTTGELLRAEWLPVGLILPLTIQILSRLCWTAIICFVAITAFDIWFQRWNFIRENRMSLEEVKREFRETEGDPEIKGKRRETHREVNQNNMLEDARKASVVVVNPTHVAVALYYKPGETDLPVVVAKGEGDLAQRIREIAEAEGIPVVQDVQLARRLLERVPVNQYIQEEFIEPIAVILRWVQGVKNAER